MLQNPMNINKLMLSAEQIFPSDIFLHEISA